METRAGIAADAEDGGASRSRGSVAGRRRRRGHRGARRAPRGNRIRGRAPAVYSMHGVVPRCPAARLFGGGGLLGRATRWGDLHASTTRRKRGPSFGRAAARRPADAKRCGPDGSTLSRNSSDVHDGVMRRSCANTRRTHAGPCSRCNGVKSRARESTRAPARASGHRAYAGRVGPRDGTDVPPRTDRGKDSPTSRSESPGAACASGVPVGERPRARCGGARAGVTPRQAGEPGDLLRPDATTPVWSGTRRADGKARSGTRRSELGVTAAFTASRWAGAGGGDVGTAAVRAASSGHARSSGDAAVESRPRRARRNGFDRPPVAERRPTEDPLPRRRSGRILRPRRKGAT